MKKYQVSLITDAEQDLLEIYDYVARTDLVGKAEKLLDKLEELCIDLERFPERGHIPPELDRVAVTVYREIHFKPYRVIYRIENMNVYIHAVLDGRRDLEQLLLQRLLRD